MSLPLALMAMLLTLAIALSLGIFAAARHGSLADTGVMGVSQIGIAIPNFWFAILLILFFAVRLHWFAAGGFPGWAEGAWPALHALILPAVALAMVQAAILARVTRSSIIEVMREDFVRTARAKGLTRQQALWRHVLRNAHDPGRHHHGPAIREPHRRHGGDRERLLSAGPRTPDLPGDQQPRPDRGARLRDAARRARRRS